MLRAEEKSCVLGRFMFQRDAETRVLAGVAEIMGPPISRLVGANLHSGSWRGAQGLGEGTALIT